MKTLFLLRHGKAEAGSAMQADYERRLVYRGQREARKVGKAFLKNGWALQKVITSPALRAAETAKIFCRQIGYAKEKITEENFLYHTDAAGLLLFIQKLPDEYSSVLLVGHNPSFEDLAQMLSPFQQHLPTGSLVAIQFPVSQWRDIKAKQGTVLATIFPKIKESDDKTKHPQEQLQQAISRSIEKTLLEQAFPLNEEARVLIEKQSKKLVKKLSQL